MRDYLNSDGPSYNYVQNRPTIAIDPDGTFIWFLAAAIVIAVVATPQIANAPGPGDKTYTRSTGDLALSMAENAVMIYAAPRLLAAGGALIAKHGILQGGAAILGYAGGGIVVAATVQKAANQIDESGTLGRIANLALALYFLRPRGAPPAATQPDAPPPPAAPAAPPVTPPPPAAPAAVEPLGTGGAARAGDPRLVYRGGSATPDNLTPRPGEDTLGLSTFDNLNAAVQPGGKAQVIDLNKLAQPLVGVPDAPPPGHVSIRPGEVATPDVLSVIREWAAARGTGTTHPLTQAIIDAIVGTVKRPKQ